MLYVIVYYAIVISDKHTVSGTPALGSRTPVAWPWVREGMAWPSNPPRGWWVKAAPKALEGAGFVEGLGLRLICRGFSGVETWFSEKK
jgi:hypothetical protein